MDNFEEKLNRHIDKVLEIQQTGENKPLSLEELKEVDLSLGMTEEEWEALMRRADESAVLAQSHLNYGNFTEALSAADQAVAINPYHRDAIWVQANALLAKYEAEDKEELLQKAKTHANELLIINPQDQKAIELLAKIQKYQKTEIVEKKNTFRNILIGAGVVVVIVLFFLFKPESKPVENTALRYELIEAEENANAAWAQVENVISRRDQMLPQILELASNSNAKIDAIKVEIEQLGQQINQSTDANQKIVLQAELQDKIKALVAAFNSNETDEKTKMILVQIEGSYNRISVEGKRYNEAVKAYNILVKKHLDEFPDFKEKAYFKGK